MLTALKEEYPLYVAATEDISSDCTCDTLTFWKQYASSFPKWKEAAAKVPITI